MSMYATPTELAGFLQKDLDTYSATQALTLASADFAQAAGTRFESTAVTYQAEGDSGNRLVLPFWPIIAVSAVRVAGVAVTDYTRIGQIMYRSAGWGGWTFPPALVEVDLTHGYTTIPDDVKAAVLETAAQAYDIPVGAVISESIDDYAVRYATTGGGLQLTKSAADVASRYRGAFAA